jgi:hypothetical protein
MANTIKIKRKPLGNTGESVPSTLTPGELAFNENTQTLYYGIGTVSPATPIEIAGSGYVTSKISTAISGVSVTAGSGLGGGGSLNTTGVTINVGAGDGISVDANAVSVNNTVVRTTDNTVVRTSGNQSISGVKTFVNIQGAYDINNETYNFAVTNNTGVNIGPDLPLKISSTSYYDTGGVFGATKEIVNKEYVTHSISGVSVTAGSGLGGGGSLNTTGVTINVGAGDGISVDANAVAVNSTVVRTTGTQSISGAKTFTTTIGDGAYTLLSDNVALKIKMFNGSNTSDAAFVLENDTDPGTTTTFRINKNGTIVSGIWGGSTIDINKGGTGATSFTSGNLLVGNNTSPITAPYSVASSVTDSSTNIPTAAAVKSYADGLLGANDAMIYKGTIGSLGSGATYITNLPTTYSAGWTIRVVTAATYAGKVCEVGDLLIAIIDRSGTGNSDSDWTVAQTNIDGAVTGPATATSGNFPIFNNDTGKVIANSAYGPTSFYSSSNPSSYTSNTGTVTSVSAGNGLNFTTITGTGSVTLGTPSDITTSTSNTLTANSHTHAFVPGGNINQYIRGDGNLATLCSGIADCTIDGGTF